MRTAVQSLLLLLLASGCVEARFTRRGDLDRTHRALPQVHRQSSVDGTVAKLRYTRTSCVKIQRSYLTENYETRHWPGQSIALLGTLVAGAAAITALATDHEGFLWPEAMPAIQPIAWATAGIVGVLSIALGWIPWGNAQDQDVLVSTVRSSEHDTVENKCEDQGYLRARAMPWRVTADGQTMTGTTPKSGELDLVSVAKDVVTQGTIDEARFRAQSRARKVSLNLKLDDAPTVSTEVPLACLNRDPTPVIFKCKVSCAEKGGAGRCQPRLERCMSMMEGDSSTCTPMFDTCLSEKVEDKAAFDSCRAACLQQDFVEACR